MIFCYCGDEFRPSSHLELGDKVPVLGSFWRLVSSEAGFADNSYLFIKCKENDTFSPLRARKQKRSGEVKLIPWCSDFAQVRRLLHRALSVKEFECLTPERLGWGRELTEQALDTCEDLLLKISAYKNRMALKKNTITALRLWRKTLQFRLRDFMIFERAMLGVPAEPPARPSWLPVEPPAATDGEIGDDCWF